MGRDFVLLGASAGGITALRSIVRSLPADLPAAVFICVHLSPESPALLGEIIDRETELEAANALDGEAIRPGRIYVAPPDFHTLIDGDRIRLHRGPREHRARPAIDALFRTAAASHGPRVLAGVLTGWLDDGSAGLLDVKSCGGGTFAQDPDTSEAPDMPRDAILLAQPDDIVPLDEIASLILRRIEDDEAASDWSAPESVRLEAHATFGRGGDYELLDRQGDLSGVSCPDCGGPMWEMGRGSQFRVRCHTGHALGEKSLLAAQRSEVERALGWRCAYSRSGRGCGAGPRTGRPATGSAGWRRSVRRKLRAKRTKSGRS